jgi:hypothetical protein
VIGEPAGANECQGAGSKPIAQGPAQPPPPRRIAVVGVHGVANHAPGATANAMADLLLSLPANDHDAPRYFSGFQSVNIQVPLQPLAVYAPDPEPPARTLFGRIFSFLQEESADFARSTRGYASGAPDSAKRGFAGHEFMRRLLYRYPGGADGDTYFTSRLEGKRGVGAAGGAADVHIYEVLWADLASPTNSVLSFLFAFFQLIFHLGSLSRLAVDTGAPWNGSTLWVVYRRTQRYAVRMLQVFIPLLKLILLIALYSYLPSVLPDLGGRTLFSIAFGALAGMVFYFLAARAFRPTIGASRFVWALGPLVAALIGAAAGSLVLLDRSRLTQPVAAVELWLTGAVLLGYVISKLGDVRRGAGIAGWGLYGFFLLAFAAYLASGFRVAEATLWVAQWIIVALRISWVILIVLAFVALILGSLAWRSVRGAAERASARAAVRTSRFALAIPCFMFLLITGLLWASLFSIARKIQDPFLQAESIGLPPRALWLSDVLVPNPREPMERAEKGCSPSAACTSARIQPFGNYSSIQFFDPAKHDYLEGVLVWSVTPGFPITLLLALAGFFLLVWWALPSVLTETLPGRDESIPPRSSTNGETSWLGSWTSRGLDGVSYVVFLSWSAIFVAPLYFLYLYPAGLLVCLRGVTATIVGYSLVGTLAAGVLAAVVKYSSPVLRAVLDVDNYLRTEPADATPRAKIVERYVSLLRYLVSYRNPADGRGYDSVVIVAHSLGTLISADLLRFLCSEGDSALAPLGLAGDGAPKQGRIDLKMFTMGSPIRQLLNRFFPYLYDWARETPDNGLKPLPVPAVTPPSMDPTSLPDPSELGLAKWVNIYRSGDYVGRSLWLTEWYRRTAGNDSDGAYPDPIYIASLGDRSEMCMGAGAHTHYWDDTAPDVAEQLNGLI